MTPGKPREPANRERLRDLMRGAMVRNTRALAALRLPRRHASTLRAAPGEDEAACYRELSALAREVASGGQHRLARAASAGRGGIVTGRGGRGGRPLRRRAIPMTRAGPRCSTAIAPSRIGAKQTALLAAAARRIRPRRRWCSSTIATAWTHLADLLRRQGTAVRAVRWRHVRAGRRMRRSTRSATEVPVLLCSESGGEGRNLQFCNTLINFDIPWNPMAIEQRIGRIDRIGQTREVFVFNLVTAGTIEDAVLRILDEKINMFELVVGEVGAILGEFEEQHDFSDAGARCLAAELGGRRAPRPSPQLEDQLLAARRQYDDVKALDDALFGNELDAA